MTSDPPRVVFFTSEVPQSVNAGSMQLFRVLKDFPSDRLLIAGMAPDPKANLLLCKYVTVRLLTYRLACTRFRRWAIGMNALNTASEPQLSRSVRLVQPFRPDLLVTVMDKLSYYKHAWALSRQLGVPLLTITMDDPQTFESTYSWLTIAFDRALRRIYGDARLSLGVSREMCSHLSQKFGKESQVFHFGPPEGISSRRPDESAKLKVPGRLTLGYAGSMSLGYRDGIATILPALETTGTQLIVYTKDTHILVDHPNIVHGGFVPPEQLWPAIRRECDAVLLPYSFGEDIARVYRTHFPTKLSEYCWTGMPIVLSGPDYATGIRWGLRHPNSAAISTSPDPKALASLLLQLREDSDRRVKLASAAVEIAHSDFDPTRIKQQFVEFLCTAARTTGVHGS